jgi:hypothetical protein
VPAIRVVDLHSLAVSTPLVATKRGVVGLTVDPASRTLFVSLPADAENTNTAVAPVNLRTRAPVGAPVATFQRQARRQPLHPGLHRLRPAEYPIAGRFPLPAQPPVLTSRGTKSAADQQGMAQPGPHLLGTPAWPPGDG